jgi:DNA-binding NtrC family response regulator
MLLKQDGHAGAPLPNIVILDLNLPKVHGYEVLALIRSSDGLRGLPVVVLTGSLNIDDEVRSRSLGVVDYLIKPVDGNGYDATRIWFEKHLVPLAKGGKNRRGEGVESATLGTIQWGRIERNSTLLGPQPQVPYFDFPMSWHN